MPAEGWCYVDVPTVPWFWDQDVRIALAPGVTCFEANKEYEHGGVSPQECFVPRLTVTPGATPTTLVVPEITKVKWLGLQCRVEFTGVTDKVVVDLRAFPPTEVRASPSRQRRRRGRQGVPRCSRRGARGRARPSGSGRARRPILAQREVSSGGTDDRRSTTSTSSRPRFSRAPRPQGPGPAVQGPVPGADLRRRVPPRPLLRDHRSKRSPRASRSSSDR